MRGVIRAKLDQDEIASDPRISDRFGISGLLRERVTLDGVNGAALEGTWKRNHPCNPKIHLTGNLRRSIMASH
jgi:hypothetical protein